MAAWRYRQEFYESDDVIGVRDWNLNQNEYASEWNGFLDRDNLPVDCITTGMMRANACNRIASHAHATAEASTNGFLVDKASNSWTTTPSTGSASLGTLTLADQTDRLLIAEYSCWWDWDNSEAVDQHTPEDFSPVHGPGISNACISFRITCAGVEVARSGWQSSNKKRGMLHIIGALPLMPGSHVLQAEVRVGYVDPFHSGRIKYGVANNVTVWDRELIAHERMR